MHWGASWGRKYPHLSLLILKKGMQILCFGVPNNNLKTFKDKKQRAQAPLKRLQGLYEDEISVSRNLAFHLDGEEKS